MKKYSILFVLLFVVSFVSAQKIKARKGYTPQIGVMVDMLEEGKKEIYKRVKNLNQDQTDYLMDEKANRIGALIMHILAVETVYQIETFEGRYFSEEEKLKWDAALNLDDKGREELKGNPIKHYLDIWDEVREKTLKVLKTKDDKWLSTNYDMVSNYHWSWYHVMEHQAKHFGQISMLLERMPK